MDTRSDRVPVDGGATVWLTGLPSAGKSTIAGLAEQRIRTAGARTHLLDGDELRAELCADLGFTRADRATNVRRIGWVARTLAGHGVVCLVAVIAPYAADRDLVREHHARAGIPFFEVLVATPLAECVCRDVKGLYARQRAGEIRGLTGVDDPYETPVSPELRLETVGRGPEQCVDELLAALEVRGLLGLSV